MLFLCHVIFCGMILQGGMASESALDTRVSNIALVTPWWLDHIVDPLQVNRHLLMDYMSDSRLFMPEPTYNNPIAILDKLRDVILRLHTDVNNVKDPSTFQLIIGSGGVQMINAAAYAMHKYFNQTLTNFSASVPHYNHFQLIAKHYDGMQWLESPCNECIEWITYPNNPDGMHQKPSFQINPAKQIYDTVYHWPSYTRDIQPLDHNIMIFSLSKLSGHASTRLGWAFVKNKEIAKLMESYIWLQTTHVSLESVLFGHHVLFTISRFKDNYFDFIYSRLIDRWEKVNNLFRGSALIRNLSERGSPCLWLECLNSSMACHLQFEAFGIVSEKGSAFGSDDTFTRICIGMAEIDFNVLMKRFSMFLLHVEPRTWDCVGCPNHFVK